jgi:hypothetical protein
MNTKQKSRLNDQVTPNNSTTNEQEIFHSFKALLEDKNLSDAELGLKVRKLCGQSKEPSSSDSNTVQVKNIHSDPFFRTGFGFPLFGNFDKMMSNMSSRMTDLSKMEDIFDNINSENLNSDNFGYSKSSYSQTTRNSDGVKKSESVQKTKKLINGKIQVYEKRIKEDEHEITTEEVRPDGQKVITKKQKFVLN